MIKSVFAVFVAFASVAAYADSFTVIRDGKEYLCRPNGPRDPEDQLNCVNEAYSGPFSREEAMQLCRGARSTAPATCAKNAYSGPFSKVESIELCTSALDNGPSECAKSAYSGPFSKEESLRLCARTGALANADCAKKAYSGPYSKEEAIRLCRDGLAPLVTKSLDLLLKSE